MNEEKTTPEKEKPGEEEPEYKVLAVESNPETLEFYRIALGKSYRVIKAENGEEALKFFYDQKPDVVIMDVLMPGVDGFEVARQIKSSREGRKTPLIFVSSKSDKLSVLTGLELGALDYITKPFDARELIMKVRSLVRFIELLKEREEELEDLTLLDDLTGLYNRRYLKPRLMEELERARRYELVFSILLLSADEFSQQEPRYGKEAGESILKMLADLLKGMVRRSDAIIRYDSHQFLIIATQTGEEGALCLAERIRRKISETPFRVSGEILNVSISIGVASTEDKRARDNSSILSIVERALSLARSGVPGHIVTSRGVE